MSSSTFSKEQRCKVMVSTSNKVNWDDRLEAEIQAKQEEKRIRESTPSGVDPIDEKDFMLTVKKLLDMSKSKPSNLLLGAYIPLFKGMVKVAEETFADSQALDKKVIALTEENLVLKARLDSILSIISTGPSNVVVPPAIPAPPIPAPPKTAPPTPAAVPVDPKSKAPSTYLTALSKKPDDVFTTVKGKYKRQPPKVFDKEYEPMRVVRHNKYDELMDTAVNKLSEATKKKVSLPSITIQCMYNGRCFNLKKDIGDGKCCKFVHGEILEAAQSYKNDEKCSYCGDELCNTRNSYVDKYTASTFYLAVYCPMHLANALSKYKITALVEILQRNFLVED
jgi:hypothetical protein